MSIFPIYVSSLPQQTGVVKGCCVWDTFGMDKSVENWMANKELFLRELNKGRKWELKVAERLIGLGYDVEVPEMGGYDMPNDPKYKSSHDMLANGKIVEVKSRALEFTGVDSFPYPSIFVKSKATYDKMEEKPVMCVCVSQKTGEMVALDVKKTEEHWSPTRFFDRVRGIHTTAYECAIERWEEFESCAERLLRMDTPGIEPRADVK